MRKAHQIMLAIMAVGFAATVSAAPASSHSSVQTQKHAREAAHAVNHEVQTCPAPNQLHLKDDLWWVGPDEWKSYSESFAKEIDYFTGAQWVGINVGKIICIYKGKGRATFPITIEREVLVPMPSGGKWGPDEGGYKNCVSLLRKDCQFKVEKPKPVGNIYEELSSFKK